jgi:hypothetical protein
MPIAISLDLAVKIHQESAMVDLAASVAILHNDRILLSEREDFEQT